MARQDRGLATWAVCLICVSSLLTLEVIYIEHWSSKVFVAEIADLSTMLCILSRLIPKPLFFLHGLGTRLPYVAYLYSLQSKLTLSCRVFIRWLRQPGAYERREGPIPLCIEGEPLEGPFRERCHWTTGGIAVAIATILLVFLVH